MKIGWTIQSQCRRKDDANIDIPEFDYLLGNR